MSSRSEHSRHACAILAGAWLLGVAAPASAIAPASAADRIAQGAALPQTLSVCAEPDNLPFSSAQEPRHGFYVDMAARLGEKLGRPVKMVWVAGDQGNRGVRASLGAGQCDLQIGLPGDVNFMAPRIFTTKSFGHAGYALVTKSGDVRDPTGLKGMRVAVQHGTPPQVALASRDDVTAVTVRTPEAAMQALQDGSADAAWIWGPVAGYLAHQLPDRPFRVIPTAGDGMQWSLAIGIRGKDRELREAVDQVFDEVARAAPAMAARYGVTLVADAGTTASDASASPAPVQTPSAAPAASPAAASAAAASAESGGVEAGRTLFNTNCSHCHGPNAESPEKSIDLRRLKRKYRDEADQVFQTTVEKGRPDKGMPTWGGVLPPASIASIKSFIDSVQVKK